MSSHTGTSHHVPVPSVPREADYEPRSVTPTRQRPPPSAFPPVVVASGSGASNFALMKQRRLSTSALPTLNQEDRASPNWRFRDEMGLSSQVAAGPNHLLRERREPSGGITKKGKSRRMARHGSDLDVEEEPAVRDKPPVKRLRRNMWTERETLDLLEGCNKWGVGNWKSILEDPAYTFQDRTPVDLKDRFRVSFPDAYRKHYPNAKTHLSDRVTSLPEGTSLVEHNSNTKKRRPFSPEEDEALKRGFEKYGTVWSSIVKDPILQSRRGTDLRDRFRNAFPDLYAKAGYKPRSKGKKTVSEPSASPVAGGDAYDPKIRPQLAVVKHHVSDGPNTFPISHTSMPPRSILSDSGVESSDEEEVTQPTMDPTASSSSNPSALRRVTFDAHQTTPSSSSSPFRVSLPRSSSSMIETMPSFTASPSSRSLLNISLETPSRSLHIQPVDDTRTWMSTPTSPTSSDYLQSSTSSSRIGNSAWGPSWMSPNPRLDMQWKDNFLGWPSIPEHGVFDRYDLYSGVSMAQDFASDAGNRHSHSYLDPAGAYPGFTHHHYAGDLISGSGVLPGQDFEYMSTTSGASHLDVGHLSLGSVDGQVEGLNLGEPFDSDNGPSYSTGMIGSETFSPSGSEPMLREVDLSLHNMSPLGDIGHTVDHSGLSLDAQSLINPQPLLQSPPTPILGARFQSFGQLGTPSAQRPLNPHYHNSPTPHHQRSMSQPPFEHRQHTPRSVSFSDLLSSEYYSPLSLNIEPLSTAALDLHYGSTGNLPRSTGNPDARYSHPQDFLQAFPSPLAMNMHSVLHDGSEEAGLKKRKRAGSWDGLI